MSNLKFVAGILDFVQNKRVASQNRLTVFGKDGIDDKICTEVFGRLEDLEKYLNGRIEEQVIVHPAWQWGSRVKGIGLVNLGKVISEIDIKKADTISSLWKYAGYGVSEKGVADKLSKGIKSPFNRYLKTMCYRLGTSLQRSKGKFYEFYVIKKGEIESRFIQRGFKIVPSDSLPKENGKKVEVFDGENKIISKGHIDMMAFRKMVKMFLSMLWVSWREAEGLTVTKPYAEQILNHSPENIYKPEDFIDKNNEAENPNENNKDERAGGEDKKLKHKRAKTTNKNKNQKRTAASKKSRKTK